MKVARLIASTIADRPREERRGRRAGRPGRSGGRRRATTPQRRGRASARSCQRRCRVMGSAITPRSWPAPGAGPTRSAPAARVESAPDRQAEVLARGLLGLGERPRLPAEVAQRRLKVQRRHVVGGARDLGPVERGGEPVALGRAHDVHVVDVPGRRRRQLADLPETELGVARGRLAAGRVHSSRLRQEDPQRRGLDRVEPRVVARRTRSRSCRASRGSAAGGSGRRARRRSRRSGRRRRARRGSSTGRS